MMKMLDTHKNIPITVNRPEGLGYIALRLLRFNQGLLYYEHPACKYKTPKWYKTVNEFSQSCNPEFSTMVVFGWIEAEKFFGTTLDEQDIYDIMGRGDEIPRVAFLGFPSEIREQLLRVAKKVGYRYNPVQDSYNR